MLRTGLLLLVTSSLVVWLRFEEISYFQGLEIKALCFSGLLTAAILFVASYLRPRNARLHPVRVRAPRHAWSRSF